MHGELNPSLLALLLAASSGCRAPQVEPAASPPTPAPARVQADEQPPAPEPEPGHAQAACGLHVRPSDFAIDCATWRAALDEVALLRQVGSQPYVEVMAWRNALAAFEAEAIPAGAQLDHVYLDLYTHLDEFVVRTAKVPNQLRAPDMALLGLQVEADVDLQMALDVIHTAAVAELGNLAILDEVGHASASLSLSPRTGPLVAHDLRVIGGKASNADTAQTWPALFEQLAQQSGVNLRLSSNLGRPEPRLPKTSPPPATNGTYRDPEATRRRMTDAADVRLTKLTTEGDERSGDAVVAHFRNRLEDLEIDYYACGLRDDPKLAGELSLDLAIGTRGQVFIIHVASHSESLPREFIDCLTRRMWDWHVYGHGKSAVVAHVSLRLQPQK